MATPRKPPRPAPHGRRQHGAVAARRRHGQPQCRLAHSVQESAAGGQVCAQVRHIRCGHDHSRRVGDAGVEEPFSALLGIEQHARGNGPEGVFLDFPVEPFLEQFTQPGLAGHEPDSIAALLYVGKQNFANALGTQRQLLLDARGEQLAHVDVVGDRQNGGGERGEDGEQEDELAAQRAGERNIGFRCRAGPRTLHLSGHPADFTRSRYRLSRSCGAGTNPRQPLTPNRKMTSTAADATYRTRKRQALKSASLSMASSSRAEARLTNHPAKTAIKSPPRGSRI